MDKAIIKTYPVSGMSCASCALNVERMLKRQPGVANASVNYANGSAVVELASVSPADPLTLQNAIRSIGYDIVIDEDKSSSADVEAQRHFNTLKINMIGALILSLPVMIISMFFMSMPFANYIMLALTLPVLTWFGRSFFINAF